MKNLIVILFPFLMVLNAQAQQDTSSIHSASHKVQMVYTLPNGQFIPRLYETPTKKEFIVDAQPMKVYLAVKFDDSTDVTSIMVWPMFFKNNESGIYVQIDSKTTGGQLFLKAGTATHIDLTVMEPGESYGVETGPYPY